MNIINCGGGAKALATATVVCPPTWGSSRSQSFCDRACRAFRTVKVQADEAWEKFRGEEAARKAAGELGRRQASAAVARRPAPGSPEARALNAARESARAAREGAPGPGAPEA